jgi:hypothetical protein
LEESWPKAAPAVPKQRSAVSQRGAVRRARVMLFVLKIKIAQADPSKQGPD